MGTILALLPVDALEINKDLPWAENIEQYCETAAATCLEKYDGNNFFNSAFQSSHSSSGGGGSSTFSLDNLICLCTWFCRRD